MTLTLTAGSGDAMLSTNAFLNQHLPCAMCRSYSLVITGLASNQNHLFMLLASQMPNHQCFHVKFGSTSSLSEIFVIGAEHVGF